jgi:putative flippase GtrA
MLTFVSVLAILIAFAMFYIVGLFNTKIAVQVSLIIFTIINLRINKKNARVAPTKLAKLVKALLYKRKLFANKVANRRLIKTLSKQKPAN